MLIQCLIALKMSSLELLNFAYYKFGKAILIYDFLRSFLANKGKSLRTMAAIPYTSRTIGHAEPMNYGVKLGKKDLANHQ